MDCVTRPAENTPKGHGSTSLHLAAIHQIFGFNGLIPSLHEYRSLGYFSPRARFIINPYTRIPASVLRQFEFPKIEESRIDMNWNRLENSEFAESSRWCISTLYYERKGEKKRKRKFTRIFNFQRPCDHDSRLWGDFLTEWQREESHLSALMHVIMSKGLRRGIGGGKNPTTSKSLENMEYVDINE